MSRKLVFIVSEDWYFMSHRLPLALAAQEQGYQVSLVTNISTYRDTLESLNIEVINFNINRALINPIKDLFGIFKLRKIIAEIGPDVIHSVALKPVIYGGLVAWRLGTKRVVNALAGLGFVYSSNTLKARILRFFVNIAFKWIFTRQNARVIVQNNEDRRILIQKGGVPEAQITLIRGSGVDVNRYQYSKEPEGIPIIAFVSRMLWDKGLGELVEACDILISKGVQHKLLIVGAPDLDNPGSIPVSQLQKWGKKSNIEWLGKVNDIERIWREANLCVLPSFYGEGLPKSLLEAASSGRAIVTTNTPGCNDVVRDGENGFLIPIKNTSALIKAMQRLIEDKDLRTEMGVKGRERVSQFFDEEIIIKQTLALYTQDI